MWFVIAPCSEADTRGYRIIIMRKPWPRSRHGIMWLHWLFAGEVIGIIAYYFTLATSHILATPIQPRTAGPSFIQIHELYYILPPRSLGPVSAPLNYNNRRPHSHGHPWEQESVLPQSIASRAGQWQNMLTCSQKVYLRSPAMSGKKSYIICEEMESGSLPCHQTQRCGRICTHTAQRGVRNNLFCALSYSPQNVYVG